MPSSRSLVISACRSNSLCAILSSVSAWGKHKHIHTIFLFFFLSLWLTCTFCIAPSTGSESNEHTAWAGLGRWEYKQLCSSPCWTQECVWVVCKSSSLFTWQGEFISDSTIRARQGRRFCFPDKPCVFFNRLRGGKTQAHSPAAPPQSTAGQHSETVTNSSGQAKTST